MLGGNHIIVSVIIPVFNSERFLRRCLDSVIAQDFEDFEMILVDDGSADNSGTICEEYAEDYSNVLVYHKKNEGASFARKYGLEKARGKFVCFIDSDDWVTLDYISKLYALIEKYNVNVSACSIQRVKIGDNSENSFRDAFQSSLLQYQELMPRFFKYEFWGFWGKIYLKSCLESLSFPSATLSEDYYVMAQLFNKERQIAYTEEPLYYYEYHENSLSHQKLSKRSFEEFENVKAVYEYSSTYLPQYRDFALSNVIETCVKLYAMAKEENCRILHKDNLALITTFLRKHVKEIFHCKPLNNKVKILSLFLSISPKIFIRLIQ